MTPYRGTSCQATIAPSLRAAFLAGQWVQTLGLQFPLVAYREVVPNVGMIYELRHYIPVPGKEAAILNRFKNHTFGIFKKNGFKTLNFWLDAKGSGQLWYVLGWESISSMETSWDTFRKDQEWIEAKKATEKDGPIVEKIESILLTQPEDITAAIA